VVECSSSRLNVFDLSTSKARLFVPRPSMNIARSDAIAFSINHCFSLINGGSSVICVRLTAPMAPISKYYASLLK